MKTIFRRLAFLVAALALVVIANRAAGADSPDLAALLQHPVFEANVPLAEVQAYIEPRVPHMPVVKTRAQWEEFAARTRRDVLEKIVFRGELAQQWRDAKGKVEWMETIEGGPGYQIKKVRYEVLPGMWTCALLYEPLRIAGKIPVYLAVNGHDPKGKSASYKQIRCINLAKRGVATLNVEWFGMGQLRTDGFSHARMNQLDLCGVSGLAPFYLIMSRGLDLLLALPYADPQRVAVSGLSGGGWQTIFISSLDPRVKLCNPVAGFSSYRTHVQFPADLGDSEQTPTDLATVTDYTQLTAMLAGRAALLTYNARDNCCFAAGHALQPLLNAARPIFDLYGEGTRLRSHINFDPGTHNYEQDNRQNFYRVVGEEFFPNDKSYNAQEIPSDAEVKTPEQLNVALPEKNADFHTLALAAAQGLPHDPGLAKRDPKAAVARLAEIVKYKPYAVVAKRIGAETKGGIQATYWQLRIGDTWTVPAVELVRGEPVVSAVLLGDDGRKDLATWAEQLLGQNKRVIAIDPFDVGESKLAGRDYEWDLLVAAVGDRPLGIQASEIAAVARWAHGRNPQTRLTLESIGPRTSLAATVAAALERPSIITLSQGNAVPSLHRVIELNWTVNEKPEFFCFGLLESFDLDQIQQLCCPPNP
jgi:hypothetical protein